MQDKVAVDLSILLFVVCYGSECRFALMIIA